MLEILKLPWQQPSATYKVHMLPAVGATAFALLARELDLFSLPQWEHYADAMPHISSPIADIHTNPCDSTSDDSNGGTSLASPASDPTPIPNPASTLVSKASPAQAPSRESAPPSTAPAPVRPPTTDFDSLLTELATSGVYKVPDEQLCQAVWPTPIAAVWTAIQHMASQVAEALQRLHNTLFETAAANEVWETLTHVLYKLLQGHITDMSLDVSDIFREVFPEVMTAWMLCDSLDVCFDCSEPVREAPACTYVAQLGRAFLRRLAADGPLAHSLFDLNSAHPYQALVLGIKPITKLMCKLALDCVCWSLLMLASLSTWAKQLYCKLLSNAQLHWAISHKLLTIIIAALAPNHAAEKSLLCSC